MNRPTDLKLQFGQNPEPSWESPCSLLVDELTLFASLCLARLMIWRTLRRKRTERKARLKCIKLIPQEERHPPLLLTANGGADDRRSCASARETQMNILPEKAGSWQQN